MAFVFLIIERILRNTGLLYHFLEFLFFRISLFYFVSLATCLEWLLIVIYTLMKKKK